MTIDARPGEDEKIPLDNNFICVSQAEQSKVAPTTYYRSRHDEGAKRKDNEGYEMR